MKWADFLARMTIGRPRTTVAFVVVLSAVSLYLAEHIELRMNWTDLLPAHNPVVVHYRDIINRFGEPSLVVALEGERDSIVAMARELEPRLKQLDVLYNVQGRFPMEFLRDNGFMLLKPDRFERTLRSVSDYTLVGALSGLNDDYESEYTESETNMRDDEVEIATGVLGLTRSLELLARATAGGGDPSAVRESVDALMLGEPWMLSLDRRMLLIQCWPHASTDQIDAIMATVGEVDDLIAEVGANHPGVYASTTGMAKISKDEMESVGLYTQILSLVALLLIYLLLGRAFRGWVVPLLELLPLVVGLLWTVGLTQILYGGMNVMTAMMMLVLLGLGIDFSIHLVARFQEGLEAGLDDFAAAREMYATTGLAVIAGALTTACAFFTLLVGDTRGVHEFGAAAGSGVLLTLLSVLLLLPTLLGIRYRRQLARGAEPVPAREGEEEPPGLSRHYYAWIGRLAATGWRHPGLFLAGVVVVVGAAGWATARIGSEYDFLELEAKGLRSVDLQRQIPRRFGVSDHAAWMVTGSLEESRALKEEFRELPVVGEVWAISDYLPPEERYEAYRPELEAFRNGPLAADRQVWRPGDAGRLAAQVERLWDNLDLMSNLAYTAGLDRIVQVIDGITGVEAETGRTDSTAILPTLSRVLAGGVDEERMTEIAAAWAGQMRATLQRMAAADRFGIEDIPADVRRAFVPKEGEGYLIHVVPRGYLWNKESQERFAGQTESVSPDVVGSERLILVMMDETLKDGKEAALLALGVITLLLLINLRGPIGLLALLPLGTGLLLMLGLMYVLGIEYNYMNLIATPIILGIGIDDGIHALHRFREQKRKGADRVAASFQFVGKAILLTSLTTMIGFGSVAFYEMRGMASFGQVLFLGVGTCFLATVFILPAVLRVALPKH